jgi:large subunit ribosomal protein L4
MNTQKLTIKHDAIRTLTANEMGLDHDQFKSAPQGISVWVRTLLQNWRQGTVAVKDRSEVNRTNKKPWKQKGSGRARAGTARSPLWRGGGVTFGPQARVRKLAVTKKVKHQALAYLAYQYLNNGKVLSFDWRIEGDKPSTVQAAKFLKDANLNNMKFVLFVPVNDFVTYASFSNIPQAKILFFDQANAFDVMNADCWVFLNKDIDSFKEMVSRWI